LKKITAAAAIAALGIPAVAEAAKPAEPGKQGRDRAAQKQSDNAGKSKRSKSKGVGFTLAGVLGAENTPTLTDGVLGDFSLDLTSANKHARNALDIDKSDVRGTGATLVDVADGDTVVVKFGDGVTDGADEGTDVSMADVQAGDRIKVIGKVQRTRTRSESGTGKPKFTYGAVDIRKVVITREAPEAESGE
jgi:hypothetical protein